MTQDKLTIVTWNINSVRRRIDLAKKLLKRWSPDILCLQEIKCIADSFPANALRDAGYPHQAVHGQKGYHGVAIVSRLPFLSVERRLLCDNGDARHVSVEIEFAGEPVRVHNFYVPSGGDDPDPKTNPKFAHKLAFIAEMSDWFADAASGQPMVLVGDLNIAPLESDVWSHKQLLRVVSHTAVETEALNALRAGGQWIDVMRHFVPAQDKLFSWWSYRSPKWEQSDKGRRLDHIWVTPHLEKTLKSMQVLREVRGWESASDHAPVIAELGA
jgi:exodeoxyribonuclease-3